MSDKTRKFYFDPSPCHILDQYTQVSILKQMEVEVPVTFYKSSNVWIGAKILIH